jgi:hypothetical protein
MEKGALCAPFAFASKEAQVMPFQLKYVDDEEDEDLEQEEPQDEDESDEENDESDE